MSLGSGTLGGGTLGGFTPIVVGGDYSVDLSVISFNATTNSIEVNQNVSHILLPPTFSLEALDTSITEDIPYYLELSNSVFKEDPQSIEYASGANIIVGTSSMDLGIYPISVTNESTSLLTTPNFISSGIAIGVSAERGNNLSSVNFPLITHPILTEAVIATINIDLRVANFKTEIQELLMAGAYNVELDTSGSYSGEGLVIEVGGDEVATVSSDGSHSFNILAGATSSSIKLKCKTLNGFVGTVDNIRLTVGFKVIPIVITMFGLDFTESVNSGLIGVI